MDIRNDSICHQVNRLIFAEKIWQQVKLPCAFIFQRTKIFINNNAKYYAKELLQRM